MALSQEDKEYCGQMALELIKNRPHLMERLKKLTPEQQRTLLQNMGVRLAARQQMEAWCKNLLKKEPKADQQESNGSDDGN